jgi:WD40 repeat protein
MKRVFFVTILLLTTQCTWGMESPVRNLSTEMMAQVGLKPEEQPLQFVSVYHSGFSMQIDTPSRLYDDSRTGHKMKKVIKITPNTYFTREDAAGNHETQCVVDARDKSLILTDLNMQKTFELYDPDGSHNRHTCVAFNTNGSLLAVGYRATFGTYPTVVLWDMVSRSIKSKAFNSLGRHFDNFSNDSVIALAFNPCDTELAVGCKGGAIKLLNYETGRMLEIQICHAKAVLALAYNRSRQLASSSEDSTIKIWEVGGDTLQCKQIIQAEQKPDIIGFYPDQSTLFSCNRYELDKISYHKVN